MLFGTQEKYRLHTKQDEDEKNLVSKANVIKGVLFHQAVQASVAMILFTVRLFISVCAYYACFEIRFRISKKRRDSHFAPSCYIVTFFFCEKIIMHATLLFRLLDVMLHVLRTM